MYLELLFCDKVLPMNMLDKIVELPRITIRELEQRVRNSHPLPRSCSSHKENSPHAHALVVMSPFYQKLKQHPQKCECQFHRLKKTLRKPTTHFRPREQNTQESSAQLNSSDIPQLTPPNKLQLDIINARNS